MILSPLWDVPGGYIYVNNVNNEANIYNVITIKLLSKLVKLRLTSMGRTKKKITGGVGFLFIYSSSSTLVLLV